MRLKNVHINCTGRQVHKITVSVVYATRDQQWVKEIQVPRGTAASEAIDQSQILSVAEELVHKQLEDLSIGIYGQRVKSDHLLEQGDRIEIYRPLRADPKEVRRQLAKIGKTMGRSD